MKSTRSKYSTWFRNQTCVQIPRQFILFTFNLPVSVRLCARHVIFFFLFSRHRLEFDRFRQKKSYENSTNRRKIGNRRRTLTLSIQQSPYHHRYQRSFTDFETEFNRVSGNISKTRWPQTQWNLLDFGFTVKTPVIQYE